MALEATDQTGKEAVNRPAGDLGGFDRRHLGVSGDDLASMLEALGVSELDQLIGEVIPEAIRSVARNDRPAHREVESLSRLRVLAEKNEVYRSFIGMGYARCHTPSVILRNVLQNPAWYTAYTPYQPEISQGRLEALLNYQTMVSDLTGLEIANASLLDESTAAAEAMAMAWRVYKGEATKFFIAADVHPQTRRVLATRAEPLGIEIVVAETPDQQPEDVFGGLFQFPGTFGDLRDYRSAIEQIHAVGGLAIMAADLLSLTLLASPGEMGADIAIGSTQRFGVPQFYGGPHAAYFATRPEFKRSIPGRLIGVSRDASGDVAYRMALQTREQHIRRDRATSNICTAQALLAIAAGLYAVYHGPEGLRQIAKRVYGQTTLLANQLREAGYEIENRSWFDTLTVLAPGQALEIHRRADAAKINFRRIDQDRVGISLDEATELQDIVDILACFEVSTDGTVAEIPAIELDLPASVARTGDFLTHSVFHKYQNGNRNDAVPASFGGQRPCAGQDHDSIGLLHDETQCRYRDDPGYLAGVCRHSPLCPGRTDGWICRNDRRVGANVVRGDRIRRGLVTAQCGVPRGIRGTVGHSRLSRQPRRSGSQHLPHSSIRAWHQSSIGNHGGHESRRRPMRRTGQH